MKKIVTGASAALLAGALIFGSTLSASATEGEEAPVVPEETTSAPIEEVPTPVTEEVPDTTQDPVTPTTDPTTEEPVVTTPPPGEEETETPVVVTPTPETKTLKWILPDGGSQENVTWPQPVFDGDLVPCGTTVTIQVDTYPYTTDEEKARTDALDDDGLLQYGEDHGWVQSWYFETFTAEDCYVPPSAANPNAVITGVCGAATFVLTNPLVEDANQLTGSFVVNVDDEFYGAYSVEAGARVEEELLFDEDSGDHVIEIYQAGTSEWKLLDDATVTSDCVLPPVEPPVVVPPVVEPPVVQPPAVTPPVTAQVVAQPTTLAETGGSDMALWAFGGIMALIAGASGLVARRFIASK